jgi:O-antigen/teichoic acid export membrane protein
MDTCEPGPYPDGCGRPDPEPEMAQSGRHLENGLKEMEKAAGGSLSRGAGKLAKNTVFNLLGYGIPLLVGFAFLPFIIRGFGTERFGVLSLVLIILGNFGFLDLGLGRATIRYVADAIGRGAPEEIPEYLWTTVLMQLALSLVGTAVLAFLARLLVAEILVIPAALQAEARSAFTLTAFSLPVIFVSASFRGVLEAAQRFDLVNAIRIPTSSANYFVPVLALLVWKSLTGIVVLLLLFRTLTLLVWIVLALREFPTLRRKPVFSARRLRPLLSYGGWATVSSLVGSVLENLDRFAIGAILSVQAVAYYSAPYEAVGRLGILPSSLVMALFPAFSVLKGGGQEGKIRSIFARSIKVVMIASGTFVVLIVLLARTILRIWLGGDFAARSGLVFQLIAASFIFLSFIYVAFSLLQGVGRTDLPARIHLVLLAVYLPLLWAGIKLAGIEGAAVAWLVHLGLHAVLLYRAARRLGYTDAVSLREVGLARVIFGLAGFAAAGGVLSLALSAPAAAVIAAAGFAPLLWFWILSAEERSWLGGGFQKAAALVVRRKA